MADQKMTEQESLLLIQQMINKAKNSYHDTGIGPILWGTVITICSLVTYFKIEYKFTLPFDIWWLTLIAIIPQIFISIRESRMNKAKRYDDKIIDSVWIAFGISIFMLTFINAKIIETLNPVFRLYIDTKGGRPDWDYGSHMNSFFLMLYAIPTFVTGACRNLKPMFWGGIICWICCIISIYTKIKVDMLLMAIAAIFAWLIPGIILWVRYKKRSTANV
jgi:hypothetical protein